MDTPFDPNPFCGRAACCFTGHRPRGLPRPDSDAMALLRLRLMQAVRAACGGGVRTFLCGGAQGFDQLAAEAVLALRGGELDIEWRASDGHILMTGPAETVFEGEWKL